MKENSLSRGQVSKVSGLGHRLGAPGLCMGLSPGYSAHEDQLRNASICETTIGVSLSLQNPNTKNGRKHQSPQVQRALLLYKLVTGDLDTHCASWEAARFTPC